MDNRSMNIRQWTKDIHELALEKGWWDDHPVDPDEKCALILTELAEAVDALRSPYDDAICDKCHGNGFIADSPDDCAKCSGSGLALGGSRYIEECADAVIRLLDMCGFYRIELSPVQPQDLLHSLGPFRITLLVGVHLELAARQLFVGRVEASTIPLQQTLKFCIQMANCDIATFEQVMLDKHDYNKTRPHKHGKVF